MIRTRTRADGSTAYDARVGRHGPKRTFDRKKEAEAYEAREKLRIRRDRAGMPTEKGPITYDKLCDLYLDNYTQKSKPWRERMLGYSRKKWGKVLVRHLQPEALGAWLHGLDLAPNTKSHILTSMRAALNMGVEWGYLQRSPARRSAIQNPGKKRLQPILPFESWDTVLAVATLAGHHGPLIRFVCATGLRPGEWMNALREDIDWKNRSMLVRGTKTDGSERTILLSDQAMDALRENPTRVGQTLLFTTPQGNKIHRANFGKYVWHPALKLAGLEPRPPYQMRHTFAVLALQAGVPLEAVSRYMGHANIQETIKTYIKFTPKMDERTRSLLNSIASKSPGTHHEAAEDGS